MLGNPYAMEGLFFVMFIKRDVAKLISEPIPTIIKPKRMEGASGFGPHAK
jgi:hypothetical protein